MRATRLGALLLGLGALGVATAGAAAAADEDAVLRVRAAQLAAAGDCPQALPLLEQARALAPRDARAALLEGRCLLLEKRYREALPPLEDALELDAGLGEAHLLLGIAHYHLGDLARAGTELDTAQTLLPPSAELSLYRGLVLLDEARAEEASTLLAEAARLDAGAVEPAASYYAGLAYSVAGREAEADEALARVGELAPGSEWERMAREAMEAERPRLRRWAVIDAGLEYDSNVSLRGEEVALPSDVSNEEDGRGVWGAELGTELFRRGRWGGGALVNYFGSAQFRETEFDRQSIGVAAWVDRLLGERSFARLQPEFGATFLDYDAFLRFYAVRAEVGHDWGRWGVSQPWVSYGYNDFLYRILGNSSERKERNRDGHRVRVGLDHVVPVRPGTVLRGGPYFSHYDSKGREFRHNAFAGWLGVGQDLPYEFGLDVRGGYGVARYQNPSTFLLPGEKVRDRRDWIGTAEVTLERPLAEWLSASAYWLFYSSNSNTRVFDYDRHIAGLRLTFGFGG